VWFRIGALENVHEPHIFPQVGLEATAMPTDDVSQLTGSALRPRDDRRFCDSATRK
jgi:hypothetical protein